MPRDDSLARRRDPSGTRNQDPSFPSYRVGASSGRRQPHVAAKGGQCDGRTRTELNITRPLAAVPVPEARRAGPADTTPTAPPEPTATPTPTPTPTGRADCQRPAGAQSISFSKTKHPNIRRHSERAIAKGWPRTLVLNRPGADARRDRLLESRDTRRGHDRDEYPPAIGRGRGAGLTRAATRAAGRPTSPTSRRARTAATARCWGSSCGASATAPSSATSSTSDSSSAAHRTACGRVRTHAGTPTPTPGRSRSTSPPATSRPGVPVTTTTCGWPSYRDWSRPPRGTAPANPATPARQSGSAPSATADHRHGDPDELRRDRQRGRTGCRLCVERGGVGAQPAMRRYAR